MRLRTSRDAARRRPCRSPRPRQPRRRSALSACSGPPQQQGVAGEDQKDDHAGDQVDHVRHSSPPTIGVAPTINAMEEDGDDDVDLDQHRAGSSPPGIRRRNAPVEHQGSIGRRPSRHNGFVKTPPRGRPVLQANSADAGGAGGRRGPRGPFSASRELGSPLGQHGDAPLIGAVGDPDADGPDQPDGAHQHQEGGDLLNGVMDHGGERLLQPRPDDGPGCRLFTTGSDKASILTRPDLNQRSIRAPVRPTSAYALLMRPPPIRMEPLAPCRHFPAAWRASAVRSRSRRLAHPRVLR